MKAENIPPPAIHCPQSRVNLKIITDIHFLNVGKMMVNCHQYQKNSLYCALVVKGHPLCNKFKVENESRECSTSSYSLPTARVNSKNINVGKMMLW